MSTLIATATDEICNFQTELKKKKKLKEEFNMFCCFRRSYKKAL